MSNFRGARPEVPLRWQTTFGIAIALVAMACGGGGGGTGNRGGSGGTGGLGGDSGAACASAGPAITTLGRISGPFSPTIDPSTPLSSLTSAQITQLCNQVDNYVSQSGAIAGWFGCRYLAMLSVIQVDSNPPAVLQAQCENYYQACVESPTPTLNGNVGFSIPWGDLGFTICTELTAPSSFVLTACTGQPLPAGCAATIGDVSACLNDIDAALATQDGMNPSCDDPALLDDAQQAELMLGRVAHNGILALATPTSCVEFQNKCPGAYGGYIAQTGGPPGTPTGGMPGGAPSGSGGVGGGALGAGGAGGGLAGSRGPGGAGGAGGGGGDPCPTPPLDGGDGTRHHIPCTDSCLCPSGSSCCNGSCVNTGNDILNCGACGNVCGGAHPYCAYGNCQDGWPCSNSGIACATQGGTCCGSACCLGGQLCCRVGSPIGMNVCAGPFDGTCPL